MIDTPLLDKPNPSDLPEVGNYKAGPAGRCSRRGSARPIHLSSSPGDVLAGVIRNRPIIVAPHHARRTWFVARSAPTTTVRLITRVFTRVASKDL